MSKMCFACVLRHLSEARRLLLEASEPENGDALRWLIAESELEIHRAESYVTDENEVRVRIRRLKMRLEESLDKGEVPDYVNIQDISQIISQILSLRKAEHEKFVKQSG